MVDVSISLRKSHLRDSVKIVIIKQAKKIIPNLKLFHMLNNLKLELMVGNIYGVG